MLGEWWKYHKLPQYSEENAIVAYFGGYLKICKAMSFDNMSNCKGVTTITIKRNEIAIL